jgi:hypothetical protein
LLKCEGERKTGKMETTARHRQRRMRTLKRQRAAVGDEILERLGAAERAVRKQAVVADADAEPAADHVAVLFWVF